jgi:hypothetical protein
MNRTNCESAGDARLQKMDSRQPRQFVNRSNRLPSLLDSAW